MVNPISIQHILTNSSSAEKVQQSNHAQADGQQKHFAAKSQEEKKSQAHKTPATEKSTQAKIKKEGQKRQDPKQMKKPKKREMEKQKKKPEKQEEPTPRIDVIV